MIVYILYVQTTDGHLVGPLLDKLIELAVSKGIPPNSIYRCRSSSKTSR